MNLNGETGLYRPTSKLVSKSDGFAIFVSYSKKPVLDNILSIHHWTINKFNEFKRKVLQNKLLDSELLYKAFLLHSGFYILTSNHD